MAVSLLLSDMETFQDVNRSYVSNFAINPPIRVCVEAPIETKVSLSAIGNCKSPIKTMHVQSISHWAPANIGPYSQATLVSGYKSLKDKFLTARFSSCRLTISFFIQTISS